MSLFGESHFSRARRVAGPSPATRLPQCDMCRGYYAELPQRNKKRGRQRGLKDMKESDLRTYLTVSLLSSPKNPLFSPWLPPSIVASPWRSYTKSSEPRMTTMIWPGSLSIALMINLMSHMSPQFRALPLCPPFPPSLPSLPIHPHLPSPILLLIWILATNSLISIQTLTSILGPSYPTQRLIHPWVRL